MNQCPLVLERKLHLNELAYLEEEARQRNMAAILKAKRKRARQIRKRKRDQRLQVIQKTYEAKIDKEVRRDEVGSLDRLKPGAYEDGRKQVWVKHGKGQWVSEFHFNTGVPVQVNAMDDAAEIRRLRQVVSKTDLLDLDLDLDPEEEQSLTANDHRWKMVFHSLKLNL